MVDSSAPQEQQASWVSIFTPVFWLLSAMTRYGGWIGFCVIATIIGAVAYYRPDDPWRVVAAPFMIAMIAFMWVILSVVSMIGDSFTMAIMKKLVRKPDARNPAHQTLHFLLSAFCYAAAIYFVSIGGNPP